MHARANKAGVNLPCLQLTIAIAIASPGHCLCYSRAYGATTRP